MTDPTAPIAGQRKVKLMKAATLCVKLGASVVRSHSKAKDPTRDRLKLEVAALKALIEQVPTPTRHVDKTCRLVVKFCKKLAVSRQKPMTRTQQKLLTDIETLYRRI